MSAPGRRQNKQANKSAAPRRLLLLVPFALLLGFVALSFSRIADLEHSDEADALPNALAGKPAPHITLPPLFAAENGGSAAPLLFDSAELRGKVSLVNFWGSWCPPCRAEHSFLMRLKDNPAFQLIGVNYKDNRENAARFLGSFGNPFAQIGYDKNGRAAIDWGVYGPPETFVLSKSGIILFRFIGPMNAQSFRSKIWPVIVKANSGS